MVYRSLKKSKTRRKYECLSSGTAASTTYDIADFYVKDDLHHHAHEYSGRISTPASDVSGLRGAHHRRYNSVVVDDRHGGGGDKPKQLVRFRSHKMLSCITGAWLIIKVFIFILFFWVWWLMINIYLHVNIRKLVLENELRHGKKESLCSCRKQVHLT